MNFKQYNFLKKNLLEKVLSAPCEKKPLPSTLVLAYLGDTIFSLYVRKRLVAVEKNKVQVINDISAFCVSAVMQAKALDAIMEDLNEEEIDIVRKGRNTKSAVPKSASVSEYRKSTGFEMLLGWLYWCESKERLYLLEDKAFTFMINFLLQEEKGG